MIEIPKAFYSYETGKPFEKCIECGKYLLDDDTEYLIEKAIKTYDGYSAIDTVFDYAICMDCAEKMRNEISKKSWASMMDYFQKNVDFESRLSHEKSNWEDYVDRCLVTNKKISECKEYQIYAHCKGKYLNLDNPPYALSSEAIDEIMNLLSNETLGEMNKFFNKHFSPDPSFFEPTPKLILV